MSSNNDSKIIIYLGVMLTIWLGPKIWRFIKNMFASTSSNSEIDSRVNTNQPQNYVAENNIQVDKMKIEATNKNIEEPISSEIQQKNSEEAILERREREKTELSPILKAFDEDSCAPFYNRTIQNIVTSYNNKELSSVDAYQSIYNIKKELDNSMGVNGISNKVAVLNNTLRLLKKDYSERFLVTPIWGEIEERFDIYNYQKYSLDLLLEYIDTGKSSSYTKGMETLENLCGACENLKNNPDETIKAMIFARAERNTAKMLNKISKMQYFPTK